MKQGDEALHTLEVRPEALDGRDAKEIGQTNNCQETEY